MRPQEFALTTPLGHAVRYAYRPSVASVLLRGEGLPLQGRRVRCEGFRVRPVAGEERQTPTGRVGEAGEREEQAASAFRSTWTACACATVARWCTTRRREEG